MKLKHLGMGAIVPRLSTQNCIDLRTQYGVASGFTSSLEENDVEDYLANHVKEEQLEEILSFLKDKFGEESNVGVLENLWINEDYQGKGHGKTLLERFIKTAKKHGATTVVLIVDYEQSQRDGFNLVHFYKRNGFYVTEWTDDYGFMFIKLK